MAKIRDWEEVPKPVKEMLQRNIGILNRSASTHAHIITSQIVAMCLYTSHASAFLVSGSTRTCRPSMGQ